MNLFQIIKLFSLKFQIILCISYIYIYILCFNIVIMWCIIYDNHRTVLAHNIILSQNTTFFLLMYKKKSNSFLNLFSGSRLGAMLDQLIDRFTTMCLMAALCYFYPKYMLFFQFSMTVDIVSHWFHLQR